MRSACASSTRLTSSIELARVLLALGEVEATRDGPLRFRSIETGEHAFEVRVLVADFHLARARQRAGLPALDLEFHREYAPRHRRRRSPADASRALAAARRACERTRARADRLDALYECQLRTWQVEDRLATWEETAREMGASPPPPR